MTNEPTRTLITPADAWRMVQRVAPVPHRRGPHSPWIQRYALEMIAGRWTEEIIHPGSGLRSRPPIVVLADGQLVDGLQRLMAILFSGTSHFMDVVVDSGEVLPSKDSEK